MRLIGNRNGIAYGAIYYVLHDIDVLPGQVVIMYLLSLCCVCGAMIQSHAGNREQARGLMRDDAVDIASDAEGSVREDRGVWTYLNSCVWGFAFIRAWVYVMFLGMGVGLLSSMPDAACITVYLWSSAALTVTLFAGGLAPHSVERLLANPGGQLSAIAATLVGTLCVSFAVLLPSPPSFLLAFGGLTTGAGSGLIHLGYGEIHRNRPPSDVGIEVPMAVLLAAVVFSIVSFVPFAAQVAVTSALPIGSGFIMMRESRRFRSCPALVWMIGERQLIVPTPRLIVRVGACALGIGLADGVARQVFMSLTGMSSFDYYHPAMLTSSIVLAALLIGFELLRRDTTFRALYKLITFVIAASIAFVPSLSYSEELYWAGPLITLIGYNAFNAFVWILLADLTYNFRLSAAATFGIGWGMLTLGSTVGQMVAALFGAGLFLTPQLASFLAAISTLVVFAVCLFVMKDDDLVDIEDRRNMVMSIGNSMDDSGVETRDVEQTDSFALPQVEAPSDHSGSPIADESGDVVSDDQGKKNSGGQRAPFKERCVKLARDCGLTPRETEILILFAKGRSAVRIQEELVISRGTVTTHLQHIYRKVDVHSKQELLDAIERERL